MAYSGAVHTSGVQRPMLNSIPGHKNLKYLPLDAIKRAIYKNPRFLSEYIALPSEKALHYCRTR